MIEYVVDSLDTVDESLRGAYVEKDGKFALDVDKYAEVSPKTQGLKTKNKELLEKVRKASDGAKRFERFAELDDSDLDDLLELRANKGKQPDPKDAGADAELKSHYDKTLKKAAEKHGSEKAALEAKAAELEKKIKHYELTVPIKETALKAGVLAEDLQVVMLDTQSRFALSDEGKIVVLDEDGDPTDITPQKFFETLYKEQRPKFYAASGAGGSGSPANAGTRSSSAKVVTRSQWDQMTAAESTKFFAEGGKIKD